MKRGDGGKTVRAFDRIQAELTAERRRAALGKARAARTSHKRTKQQRQAERDEIAAYLARVPSQEY